MRDRCLDEGGDDRRRGTHQHTASRWPLAELAFQTITVGTAIVCADGISVAAGATTHDASEAHAAAAMVANAQKRRDRRRRVQDRHSDVCPNGRPGRHSRSRHRHHRTATTSTHVDEYLASGPTTQFDPTFFVWAKKSKINTAVLIDHRRAKTTRALTQEQRLAWLEELLTGDA
jgi:hypothetical protein